MVVALLCMSGSVRADWGNQLTLSMDNYMHYFNIAKVGDPKERVNVVFDTKVLWSGIVQNDAIGTDVVSNYKLGESSTARDTGHETSADVDDRTYYGDFATDNICLQDGRLCVDDFPFLAINDVSVGENEFQGFIGLAPPKDSEMMSFTTNLRDQNSIASAKVAINYNVDAKDSSAIDFGIFDFERVEGG